MKTIAREILERYEEENMWGVSLEESSQDVTTVKKALKDAIASRNFLKVAAILLAMGIPAVIVHRILKQKKAEDVMNQLSENLSSLEEALGFTKLKNFEPNEELIRAQMDNQTYNAAAAIREAHTQGAVRGTVVGILYWCLVQLFSTVTIVAAIIGAYIVFKKR